MTDKFTVIDDIIDHAREIAKRGHGVGLVQTFDFIKAYIGQNAEVVVLVRLGAAEEYEIVFRACGPVRCFDHPRPVVGMCDLDAADVGEHWRERPVFVESTDLGERVEAIIPSLVRIERTNIRTNFRRDISQVLAVDDLVEFGSGAPEGEVKAFGVGSTAQFGALGSDVVKGGSQVVGAVSCDSLEVGIEPLDRSKFMSLLSG